MKMKLAAAVALLGSVFATSSFAADMPLKAPPMPVPVAPACVWCGGYIGINGGYAWGNNVGPVTFTNSVGEVFTTTGTTFNPRGGFGGGQIGYNWQNGAFVWGLEADLQGAALKSNTSGGVTFFGDHYAGERTIDFFGTFRGRLGVTAGNALFYATGGFAYGRVNDSVMETNFLPGWVIGNNTDRAGYVVGGGVEYKIVTAWSAKIEYQYINLGHDTLTGIYTGGGTVAIQSNALNDHFSTVRVGLNYQFH